MIGTSNDLKKKEKERIFDTVLFDFDGTVMDTNDIILQSWQHTFKTLTGKKGDENYILATYGEILEESMKRTFPEYNPKEALEIYRSYQYERFLDLISLFPNMEETLKEIKNRNYKTALVTSRMSRTTMAAVKFFKLERFFDEIVTKEDCNRFKPDPEPINIALRRLDSESSKALMVGDSLSDLGCAANAGVCFAMVAWSASVNPFKLKGNETPDFIISEARELLYIL